MTDQPPPADTPETAERRREVEYRRALPLVWWATLLVPPAVTAAALAATWLARGWEAAAGIVGLAVSSLFLGKFIILGGSNGSPIPLTREGLAAMVVVMDLMTACWFVFHLDVMQRVPVLGPRFTLLVAGGESLLARFPWVRRTAFVGLVAFVMIPFAMTGSVGGAILARLCGVGRGAAFAAIGLGSVLGAGAIYLGGTAITAVLPRDNPAWKIGGGVVLVAVILFLNWRYSRLARTVRVVSPAGD